MATAVSPRRCGAAPRRRRSIRQALLPRDDLDAAAAADSDEHHLAGDSCVVFMAALGIAAAMSRNVANHENDQTLRLASPNATVQWRPCYGRRVILLSRSTWLKPTERRRRRSWWSTSAHSVAGWAP